MHLGSAEFTQRIRSLASDTPDAIGSLIIALAQVDPQQLQSAQRLLASFFLSLIDQAQSSAKPPGSPSAAKLSVGDISLLYLHLKPGNSARFLLLALLASIGTADSLTEFVVLLLQDSLHSEKDILTAFEPLFAKVDYDPANLFPELFGGLEQPKVASIVLDLANYVFRHGLTNTHPIADRVTQMRQLLSNLTSRLELLAENPTKNDTDAESIAETVADSTALIISLCDSLALVDDREAVDVLCKVAAMPHRRVRVEANAALAKLDDEKGRQELIEMASDPAIRLRALKYAEELACLDEVDPENQTDIALAESRLAIWLAQPAQMGIAPTQLEFVDQRTQYWPGFDEPVDCFLFRFSYSLGGNEYANIGITGPTTHAFLGDLADLPINQIYAAFAGWQAEHEEIEQFDPDDLNPHFQTDVSRLQRRLHDRGFDSIEPAVLGRFFGQSVLVAKAAREEQVGIAIVDQQDETWFPQVSKRNPLSPEEAYCIYKGHQLLQAFNPESADE